MKHNGRNACALIATVSLFPPFFYLLHSFHYQGDNKTIRPFVFKGHGSIAHSAWTHGSKGTLIEFLSRIMHQSVQAAPFPPPPLPLFGRDIAGHLRGMEWTSQRAAGIGDFDLFCRSSKNSGGVDRGIFNRGGLSQESLVPFGHERGVYPCDGSKMSGFYWLK